MGRRSRFKKERRAQKEQEIPEKPKRRRFLKVAGSTAVLLAAGAAIYHLSIPPTFDEAYKHQSKRDRWLRSLDDRPYTKKVIATPEVLDYLRTEHNHIPPEAAFSTIRAVEKEKLGKGSHSEIYVLSECFNPLYERISTSLGKVVENVMNNHELVHADHFHSGIPGYPNELFRGNPKLFVVVSELVAHRSEYDTLEKIAREDKFARYYRAHLKDVVIPYLQILPELTDNIELIRNTRKELWF